MKNTAFLTTFFPQNKKFFKDFFISLSDQTYKDFDLIIVNDGIENLSDLTNSYLNLDITIINSNSTPAKNREFGINYCLDKKYDFIIFGDSDDYFIDNRIEKSMEILIDSDIVVNDLNLFNNKSVFERKYLSNRVKNHQNIEFEFIKDKNIFGFSNSGLKTSKIKKTDIPIDLIAVDWFFFSNLLLNDCKATFTNETITNYRQHSQNIIGLKKINEISFNETIKIKLKHFKALSSDKNQFENEIKRLYSMSFNDTEINYPLWWELA